MYFYLIVALQAYCVYHCYTKRNDYYWIFAILFLPVIGCLLYLFINVFQKRDIDKVQEGISAVIRPHKKIADLEKKFKFSATFENQVALADAYLESEQFDKAIDNYSSSLKNVFKEDYYVLSKLQEAYYFSSEFEKSLEYAEKIKNHTKFKKSRSAFLYALANEKVGDVEKAEEVLKTFDAPFSRYQERLELAKFFIRNAKQSQANELLNEIVRESESMSKENFRQNRILLKKAKELLSVNF